MAAQARPKSCSSNPKCSSVRGGRTEASPADKPNSICVRVPLTIRKRGGRKLILAPDGTHIAAPTAARPVDSAIVRALARAFRWRDMLEDGTFATISEIAKAEGINDSYVSRVLRLTLLAPEAVEALLEERDLTLLKLALSKHISVDWADQKLAQTTKE